MSNRMVDSVFQTVDMSALSDAERLLLVAYADTCNDSGEGIYASDEYTEWKTGIALRTIQAVKKRWRDSGVLISTGFRHVPSGQTCNADVTIQRGSGGRGWRPMYRLTLEPLPKKLPWRDPKLKKVAISATFNPGITIDSEQQNVACIATFQPDEKVASSSTEGRSLTQQKVASSSTEGRSLTQHNKEEPLVEPLGEPQEGTRPARAGLSQSERDTWDLRRWQREMKLTEPQPGTYIADPVEHWRARVRDAAFRAALTPERITELLKQHYPNDPNIDLIYQQQPLFEERA